jgi:hypothetical protein
VNYADLLQLALGNLGTLVVLIVLAVAFQREWITTGSLLSRERERTDKVDAQADKMLDILTDILHRLDVADEKEKWRREGQ